MASPAPSELTEETIRVPAAVRFPVELTPPEGFDPALIETWPRVEGRLEWVAGRLLYMPPCGEEQCFTVADATTVLGIWCRERPGFVVGTNEAGLRLGDDTRGADAAIWRRADMGKVHSGFSRVVPVLAVEVAGQDEGEAVLRDKADWYFDRGVALVWILLPASREAIVVTRRGDTRHRPGDRLPEHPEVPGLTPSVDDLFRQVSLLA